MLHVTECPHETAKGGCYQCTRPGDGIIFDSPIEGEGILFLCTGCLRDANKLATLGRARMERTARAEARA